MYKLSVILILSILINHLSSFGQKNTGFEIKETIITDSAQKRTLKDYKRQSPIFFEDEKYLVRKTCSGEWGGSIWFKNKFTGIEYGCAATCPIMVNKVNGKYIVTNTLAHLNGASEILEIENPDSLAIKLSEPKKKKWKRTIKYVGDDESKFTKGSKQLADSVGVITLASFPFEGQIFHVLANQSKTFLTKTENGKFVTIDIISEKRIWTYHPEVIRTTDNLIVVFFDNTKTSGYLEINGNKINLVRYR